jgi:hypothetical protein
MATQEEDVQIESLLPRRRKQDDEADSDEDAFHDAQEDAASEVGSEAGKFRKSILIWVSNQKPMDPAINRTLPPAVEMYIA